MLLSCASPMAAINMSAVSDDQSCRTTSVSYAPTGAKFCPLSIDLMVSQFGILVVVREDVRVRVRVISWVPTKVPGPVGPEIWPAREAPSSEEVRNLKPSSNSDRRVLNFVKFACKILSTYGSSSPPNRRHFEGSEGKRCGSGIRSLWSCNY